MRVSPMNLRACVWGFVVGLAFAPASAAAAEDCVAMNRELGEMAKQIQADDAARAAEVIKFNDNRDARNNAKFDLDLALASQSPESEIEGLRAIYKQHRDAAEAAKSEIDRLNADIDKRSVSFGEKRTIFNAQCVKD
ncbi:MAG: hypothetical protein AAF719_00775 [Pseudomonadota bacterium]